MFLLNEAGAIIGGERVSLGDTCWIPFVPPDEAGRYTLQFFAKLDAGKHFRTNGGLILRQHA